jgi:hypothetical protein
VREPDTRIQRQRASKVLLGRLIPVRMHFRCAGWMRDAKSSARGAAFCDRVSPRGKML